MRHVDLDFLRKHRRPPLAAWLLLILGGALAAMTFLRHQSLEEKIAREKGLAMKFKADIAQAGRAERRAWATRPPAQAELKNLLATPWGTFFEKLERTRGNEIALLSLEADDRRKVASVTAEARTAEDMLAYLERLKKEAGPLAVVLASHKLQEDDAQRPLRFVLRMEWRP